MLQSLVGLAKRLFIDFSDDFRLIFEDDCYKLADPYNPSCHLLEISLISNQKFTGNKIIDLQKSLNVSSKWILGFIHGYRGDMIIFNNKDYYIGHFLGQKMKINIADNNNAVPI